MHDKLNNAISTFIGKINELNQTFETSINSSIEMYNKEKDKLQKQLVFEQNALENKENYDLKYK